MLRNKAFILVFTLTVCTNLLFGVVKPAGVFGDHMVLQQGHSIPIWGTSSPNENVTIEILNQKVTALADSDGKWKLFLNSIDTGGPYTMKINGNNNTISIKDIYVGEVWLCSGQSNMDMTVAKEDRYWCGVYNEEQEVAAANYPLIRVFDVPFVTSDKIQDDIDSKWEICCPDSVGHFSASAYFFARELYKELNTPVGLVTTAFGASTAEAWTSQAALETEADLAFLLENYKDICNNYDSGNAIKEYQAKLDEWKVASEKAKSQGTKEPRKPKKPRNPHTDQHSPCVLYNGMVAPLIPYAIRGSIWYQGESNTPTADVYDLIMETMVDCWRDDWGQGDFPFYYVQLASYRDKSTVPCKGSGTTLVRDMQFRNMTIPNSGMAVTVDIGDAKNIHPKNKQEVGRRLALLALNRTYDHNIVDSGPVYDFMLINGNKIVIHFKSIGSGLTAKSDKLEGFAIAGKDRKFVWANAKIHGNNVIVSSPDIDHPVAVRYGWNDNPNVSLFNKEGLPASPFRSDNY